jgi:hypothetical protein
MDRGSLLDSGIEKPAGLFDNRTTRAFPVEISNTRAEAMSPETPFITKAEFDANEPNLLSDLRRWYDEQKQNPDAPPSNPATAGAWSHLPDIDSKAVVKASPIIKKYLGVRLDPKLIRKGGYKSFDHLVGDLLPKLRELCPDNASGVSGGFQAN